MIMFTTIANKITPIPSLISSLYTMHLSRKGQYPHPSVNQERFRFALV